MKPPEFDLRQRRCNCCPTCRGRRGEQKIDGKHKDAASDVPPTDGGGAKCLAQSPPPKKALSRAAGVRLPRAIDQKRVRTKKNQTKILRWMPSAIRSNKNEPYPQNDFKGSVARDQQKERGRPDDPARERCRKAAPPRKVSAVPSTVFFAPECGPRRAAALRQETFSSSRRRPSRRAGPVEICRGSALLRANPHAVGPGKIQTNMQSLYVKDEKTLYTYS